MKAILVFLLYFAICLPAWARVRRVEATQDQIVTVKTALGIATIVQVPDRPNSIVVGDQASFKVEYLDQAITIKPLRGNAKSNLYIYTDFRRYNVQLVTGLEASADYVVYLDNPKAKVEKSTVRWMPVGKSLAGDGITIVAKRVARTRDGVLLIELTISSQKRERFRPEWLWLTQGSVTRPIQNLFLSSLEVGPHESVTGTIQILKSEVDANASLKIELRKKKNTFLLLPKVAAWK